MNWIGKERMAIKPVSVSIKPQLGWKMNSISQPNYNFYLHNIKRKLLWWIFFIKSSDDFVNIKVRIFYVNGVNDVFLNYVLYHLLELEIIYVICILYILYTDTFDFCIHSWLSWNPTQKNFWHQHAVNLKVICSPRPGRALYYGNGVQLSISSCHKISIQISKPNLYPACS